MSALVLVPTPLRALRAARRLCDAQGGLLFDARVATLDALAPEVLAAAGDRRPVLSRLAERLLAAESADGLAAAFSRRAAGAPGALARGLCGALAELRRGEVAPAGLREAAQLAPGRVRERLEALAAALLRHEERLEASGALDRAGAARAAVEALEGGRARGVLRDLDLLVVDGFQSLSPAAFGLVATAVHRARRSHLRVPFFPDRPDASSAAEPLLRRLESLHDASTRSEVEIVLERLDGGSGRAPRIAGALRAVAGGEGGPRDERGTVLAAVGAGEEDEAERAAGLALRLLDQGFAPDDTVVIAPSPARSGPPLARAFAALGVPFATAGGPAARDLPVVRAVRDLLSAAVRPSRASLEAVLASPYLALAHGPERLGEILDRAGALEGRCDPEEALARRAVALTSRKAARERATSLRAREALASARGVLERLGRPARAREHARRLQTLLPGVRRRAARGEPPLVRQDVLALRCVEGTLEDLVRALGAIGRADEVLTVERWRSLVEIALETVAAPPVPEPAAGAVELWPVSEAPGLAARAAIVVGCARGAFPAPRAPEPLLREEERAAVNRAAGRRAVRTGPALRAERLHAAFCALAAGREAVAVTWAGAGPEGAGAGPAPLAVDLLTAAGVDLPAVGEPSDPAPSRRSGAQALRSAARRWREQGALAVEDDAALQGRVASALARGAIETERRRAILAGRASPFVGKVPGPLLELYRQRLPAEWSPSQLELHARCPYRLFSGLVLGLLDPDVPDLDMHPSDEGRLAHAVLEELFRARLARGAARLLGTAAERDELRLQAERVMGRFEAEGRVGDPATWPGRRASLLARLDRALDAERQAQDEAEGEGAGAALPALVEFRFGGDAEAPPLLVSSGGEEVRLRGRIDRVDAATDRLVVVDYKDSRDAASWKRKLKPEALGVTNFQVPTYLMAVDRELPGRARLEATYLLLRSAERLEPLRASGADPLLAPRADGGGSARVDAERPASFAERVVAAVGRIASGELPAVSRDCAGCGYGAVCRAEGIARPAGGDG